MMPNVARNLTENRLDLDASYMRRNNLIHTRVIKELGDFRREFITRTHAVIICYEGVSLCLRLA